MALWLTIKEFKEKLLGFTSRWIILGPSDRTECGTRVVSEGDILGRNQPIRWGLKDFFFFRRKEVGGYWLPFYSIWACEPTLGGNGLSFMHYTNSTFASQLSYWALWQMSIVQQHKCKNGFFFKSHKIIKCPQFNNFHLPLRLYQVISKVGT